MGIWNLDTADTLGDIMFDHDVSRPYLKVFNVTVNTSWGPMRDCNFVSGENIIAPPREPSMGKLVARGCAEGFQACDRPCSDCDFGAYYAFPKEGGCPRAAAIGTDGCTWK